jgi:uncharacterized protein (TIGR02145 family)
MQIQRFFILIVTIVFIAINGNPVFSSDSISVMGEPYRGENRGIDSFEQELKSPQDIRDAPFIEANQDISKSQGAAVSDDSVPNQIGFARQIERLSDHLRFKKTLNWRKLQDGGHTATIIISSPEARALRVGIIVNKLPQETEFRFFAINNGTGGPSATLITGSQINHLLQLNKIADPDHPDSQTYWSPIVAGESLGIEIYLPPGIHPDKFDIAIPFLSHLVVSPFVSRSESSILKNYGDSDSCQNDATCYPGWQNMGSSVAKMVYTESGGSYICTGTLLNDKDPSTWIPYFITANHCIGSQTVASTLLTHWFFESASCDSTIRNKKYTTRYGGAKLLWTKRLTTSSLDSNQDVSFLQLNDNPPSGVYYAGWNPAIGSGTFTGIHHPSGDWKKISFGHQGGDYKCYDTYGGYYDCSASSTGSFFRIYWADGGTEGGSSGSGLFINDQLIGIMLGGTIDPCGGSSTYSKFGAAYSAGNLSKWLDPYPTPCTYSISSSSGSFTSSGGDKTVLVTASSTSCSWTTSETLSWVSVSPSGGTGSLNVTVTVNPNSGAARNGSITIAGRTYTINQAAVNDIPVSGLSKTQVSQLYVSVFNRASEGEGNTYWQPQPYMATAATAMLDTQAAKDYFGGSLDTNQAFIEHIYLNTLNKNPWDDPVGITYWVNQLNGGKTRGEVVAELVGVIKDYAPGGLYYDSADQLAINAYNQFTNRVDVSNYMADNVWDTPENWQTSTSFSNGLVVTDDPASVFAAMVVVNGFADEPVLPGPCGAYVAPGVWKEFDCYNLAAIGKTTNDDPFTPSWRLIGGYWQWGKKGPDPSEWYDTNTSHFAHGPSGPGLGDANSGQISGWGLIDAIDNAWNDSNKTANDPCPSGFRIPTKIQWDGVIDNNAQNIVGSWSTTWEDHTNYSAARFFGYNLMLPAAGIRYYHSGSLGGRGYYGYYWSSSQDASSSAWYLFSYSGGAISYQPLSCRRYAYSLRCVAE